MDLVVLAEAFLEEEGHQEAGKMRKNNKRMIKLKYLPALSKYKYFCCEDIIKDKRLCKNLWLEFLLNSSLAEAAKKANNNPPIEQQLLKALRWYCAFRWLFKKNYFLDKLLAEKKRQIPSLRGEEYRKERRSFIKAIIYAGLC